MSPDVELVAQLLARALDLPPGERAAFVEREACGDVGLRAELASLLAHHEADSAFLGGTPARPCAPSAPLSVASYRILGLLGEGGMGVVYRAEQDRPRRVVALKLIRPGCLSPRMLQRFEREAQLLGRLHHPGIAQVYEAGSARVAGVQTPFLASSWSRARRSRATPSRRASTAARASCCSRSATRSSTRTARASCTATSSLRTC